jgi:hypothetical protein
MNARVQALCTDNNEAFAQHGTVYFRWEAMVSVPLQPLLSAKAGWAEPYPVAKHRQIDLSFINERYTTNMRADLVVTDNPSEIYQTITQAFIVKTFKLSVISERAQTLFGREVTSWADFWTFTPQERGLVLVEPLARHCMMQRRSEEDVLGYTHLSWEEFSRRYQVILPNEPDELITAFPRIEHSSYLGFTRNPLNTNPGELNDHQFAITFSMSPEGKEMIDQMYLSIYQQERLWKDKAASRFSLPTENLELFVASLEQQSLRDSLYLIPGSAAVSFTTAPPLFRKVDYAYYFSDQRFDLKELTEIARDCGLKGYSSKTKPELTIMLSEFLASQPPVETTPALIFPLDHSAGMSVKLNAVAELNADSEAIKANKQRSPKEHFIFASRIVSNAVYAPHTQGASAGRIPTDGSFTQYRGIKPLEIL